MKIDLTKSQCESLIDFIELNLLDVIRRDTDIDNLEWVENILTANTLFHLAIAESGKPMENPPKAPEEMTRKAMHDAIVNACCDRSCLDCPLYKFKSNCFADKNLERNYRTLKEAGLF